MGARQRQQQQQQHSSSINRQQGTINAKYCCRLQALTVKRRSTHTHTHTFTQVHKDTHTCRATRVPLRIRNVCRHYRRHQRVPLPLQGHEMCNSRRVAPISRNAIRKYLNCIEKQLAREGFASSNTKKEKQRNKIK